MKRYHILSSLVLLVLIHFSSAGQKIPALDECIATYQNDTLIIGNSRMTARFFWNRGDFSLKSISNTDYNQLVKFGSGSRFLTIGKMTDSILDVKLNARNIPGTKASHPYLMVEVLTNYRQLDVKKEFRIYPGSPVLACDYYVKLRTNQPVSFKPEETSLLDLNMQGIHWNLNAIEFFDRTDVNNNLVKEDDVQTYLLSSIFLKGNILYAKNSVSKNAFLILKEAPCSFVQLNYPGYDFYNRSNILSVRGIGVAPSDLVLNKWIRTYSIAIGAAGSSEYEFLSTLRSYQKKLRLMLPERDDMIMMNTWGDRNADANIDEVFIKREIDNCRRLSISHFQIDDGWQQGKSKNSADRGKATLWDSWSAQDWQPAREKFPNGFKVVADYAKQNNVSLGLWFHPSNSNNYSGWRQDAETIIGLYRTYGVKYIKIDGVKLPNKISEINLRSFFDTVQAATGSEVVFNLDATADNRSGYHYFYEYGNIFLENRYTDYGRYYPFWTLRNLWMLSKYVPPEKLQIEFLNKWRNSEKYPGGDPFAPYGLPFEYNFAVTMVAQPLAWFEGSGLPGEAFRVAPVIEKYRQIQADIHSGQTFPVGDEPSGSSWTGFQSVQGNAGYFLIFRENNPSSSGKINTYLTPGTRVRFQKILGSGDDFNGVAGNKGEIEFNLPQVHSYSLYKYFTE